MKPHYKVLLGLFLAASAFFFASPFFLPLSGGKLTDEEDNFLSQENGLTWCKVCNSTTFTDQIECEVIEVSDTKKFDGVCIWPLALHSIGIVLLAIGCIIGIRGLYVGEARFKKLRPLFTCFLFFGSFLVGIGLLIWRGECQQNCNPSFHLGLIKWFKIVALFDVLWVAISLLLYTQEIKENGCPKGDRSSGSLDFSSDQTGYREVDGDGSVNNSILTEH